MRFAHPASFRPPPFVVGLAWIAIIGVVDWLTGAELAFSAFYLPGIAWEAWFSGRRQALAMAFCSALAWLLAEMAYQLDYSSPFIPYWNAGIRLCFFVITALLTFEVRSHQHTEKILREQGRVLRSILNSMGDGVVVVDANANILAFNPAAERLLGTRAATGNAMAWAASMDALHVEGGARKTGEHGPLSLAISGKNPCVDEISVRGGDNDETRILGITVQPLLTSEPSGMVMIFTNLTNKRNIEKKIAEASEREQRRIGRELHDGVCQHLVGVAFAAGSLQSTLESRSLVTEAEAAGEIAHLINDAIREARDLAHGLYPVGLEEGIDLALRSLISSTQERTGISCRADLDAQLPVLDPVVAMHLYRIAQEAVSNAIRHGHPTEIRVSFKSTGDQVTLTIEDNGRGFNPTRSTPTGIGLNLMQYRSHLMGGTLDITSRPGDGTCVSCTLTPHEKQDVPP